MKRWRVGGGLALAAALALMACPRASPDRAVPAPVEIEWPDAAAPMDAPDGGAALVGKTGSEPSSPNAQATP